MPLVLEWIVIGFFSAVGWKGADVMFDKMDTPKTSISQEIDKKMEPKPPKAEKKDDS